MKMLFVAISLVALAACTREPVNPTGIYRLAGVEKSMVLHVRTSGEYVLQIDGRDRNPDEIRGRWEEASPAGTLAFHGIVWHGTEPETGQGTWAAMLDSDGDICLDAEPMACFAKDDGA